MTTLGGALLLAMVMAVPASAGGNGANQVLPGTNYPPGDGECNAPPGGSAHYAIVMTGDLVGCVYGVVTSYQGPGPSGVYKERAAETFVGTYHGREGTFRMMDTSTRSRPCLGQRSSFGFCKHPIVEGSGTGVFEGVSGRLDFRDDVDDPDDVSYPYKVTSGTSTSDKGRNQTATGPLPRRGSRRVRLRCVGAE